MKKTIQYIAITGLAMSVALPALAQNINTVQSRLDRIEREMNTLSRSIYKGDVPPPTMQVAQADASQTAAMEMRLNQIEDQMRRLTGMIEENSYRLRKLEANGVATSPSNQGQSGAYANDMNNTTSSSSSSLQVDETPYQLGTVGGNRAETPARLYDNAFSYLQINDYASAQATFDDFIVKYPDHSLVENAKYWLGETYYAREDYSAASQAFARAFKDSPEGQKAPDTLLKLAMSLKAQDMSTEACLTLDELAKRFPMAPSIVMTKANEERQLYGCDS